MCINILNFIPKKDNIYTQKHIRITLMKQEKHFEKIGGKQSKK